MNSNQQQQPYIIACGYRQIRIPKSNLLFPAWLISFGNKTCWWRSKKDVCKLGGAARLFPKSAWKKLSESAPWMRPGEEEVPLLSELCENHWTDRMQKCLRQIDQFLQQCSQSTSDEGQNAWTHFCRAEHNADLADDGDGASQPPQQRGNALGQYFCSPSNAQTVVNVFVDVINRLSERQICVVEPSCGHGRLVQTMIEKYPAVDWSVLGMDIDPTAIEVCKKQLPHDNLKWIATDFLTSQRYDFVSETATVVALGGPPYSAGAGHALDMRRDLPVRFVEHAIFQWRAQLVVFIMPERCRYENYNHLEGYLQKTIELQESIFYFQDQTPIRQPSIIQCFWTGHDSVR